jgi:hypothetical protein
MGTITMTEKAPPGGGTIEAKLWFKTECGQCSGQQEDGSVALHWDEDSSYAEDFAVAHVNANADHVVTITTQVLILPPEARQSSLD